MIYSTAGLLNEQKLTKENALSRVLNLKGEEMIMPAHPFNSKCFVNCTQFTEEYENTFFTGVNNSSGTQIFSFEYVTIESGIEETEKELTGKFIILEGRLEKVSVEGNILPRFKLNFIEGKYQVIEN